MFDILQEKYCIFLGYIDGNFTVLYTDGSTYSGWKLNFRDIEYMEFLNELLL